MSIEYNKNMRIIFYKCGQIEVIEDDPSADSRKEQIRRRKYLFTFENKNELLELLRSDKQLWDFLRRKL